MDLKGRSIWLLGAAGLAVLLVFLFLTLLYPAPASSASLEAPAAIFEVNSNADDTDIGGCQSPPTGDCTLREAIQAANAVAGTEEVVIEFNLPLGSRTITLLAALPSLNRGHTTIDGYSQAGASPATGSSPATILIKIDCSGRNINGFNLLSAYNRVKGLAITGCGFGGVSIYGTAAANNVVSGNYIGVNEWGTSAAANTVGVLIQDGAHDNLIGGDEAAERNLISGNLWHGVSINVLSSGKPMSNTVSGNYIGLARGGDSAIANGWNGIYLGSGTKYNKIGGDTEYERNVISGNKLDGIYLWGEGTEFNRISGNYIGPNASGEFLPASSQTNGVRVDGKAKYNWVGGPGIHLMNLISGNNRDGVRIAGSETMSNTISYNLIGLNGDYEDGLANNWYGVTITNSASYNRIGPQNLISGNGLGGVRIYGSGAVSNTVTYNAIGVGLDGQTAIPNSGQGVIIQAGASYNLIGGMFHFEGNWIAGNAQDGVRIDGVNSSYNRVLGNQIGVDITGGVAIPNHQNGVRVSGGASYNSIGGGMPGDGNLISGNILDGIHIDAVVSALDSEHNQILNNIIGVNLTATAAIPNNLGIHLLDGASYTLIGGDLRYGSNLIAGNTNQGIFLEGDDTQNNEIRGNFIGIHPIDFTDLGNGAEGILIDNEAKMNFAGPSNVIAYNGYASDTCGVVINGFLTYGNTLSRNSIFANDIRGICLSNDANMEIDPPVITSAELGSVTVLGNACPSCEVELFNSPDNERQGRYYIGSAHANAGGNFTITVPHITYPYLTATTTDASGNTSEFSAVFDSGIQSIFLPMLKH